MFTFTNEQLDLFVNRLNFCINASGLTGNGYAEACGIPNPTLYRYLNKKRCPTLEILIPIAVFSNVTIEWLLGLDDYPAGEIPDSMLTAAKFNHVNSHDKKTIQKIVGIE